MAAVAEGEAAYCAAAEHPTKWGNLVISLDLNALIDTILGLVSSVL